MPRLDPRAVDDFFGGGFGEQFQTEDDPLAALFEMLTGGGELDPALLETLGITPEMLGMDAATAPSFEPTGFGAPPHPDVPSDFVDDAPPIAFDDQGGIIRNPQPGPPVIPRDFIDDAPPPVFDDVPPAFGPSGTTVTTINPPFSNPADFLDDIDRPIRPGRPRDVLDGGGGGIFFGDGGFGGVGGPNPRPPQQPFSLPNFPILGGDKGRLEEALLALAYQSGALQTAQGKALFEAMFPALKAILTGEEGGFSKEALAAMRGEAIEGTGRQFREATSGLKRSLSRRGLFGGSAPASGLAGREFSELAEAGAGATSGALRGITQANEQQRLQNLFNAFNIAAGFPSNPASSISAGGAIAGNQPGGFGKSLLSSLAGTGIGVLGDVLGDLLKSKIPKPKTTGGGNPFSFDLNFGFR